METACGLTRTRAVEAVRLENEISMHENEIFAKIFHGWESYERNSVQSNFLWNIFWGEKTYPRDKTSISHGYIIFMHGNFICSCMEISYFHHGNFIFSSWKFHIFMHGNFKFTCMEISYLHAWKFHIYMHGNFIFSYLHAWKFHIYMHENEIYMHETFMPWFFHAWNISYG